MIDREKVIETFKERICTCSMIGDGFDVTINWRLADDILALLKEQEAVVRVVRCKDCKYNDDGECIIKAGWFPVKPDWFCADGERQEGR